MPYRAALDWLNFFLADVRGGLGPYVSVFLLTEEEWNQAQIGEVLTISGLMGISLHIPIGAFIDATRGKRGLLVAGVATLAAAGVAIERMPTWLVVLAADIWAPSLRPRSQRRRWRGVPRGDFHLPVEAVGCAVKAGIGGR